jgi:ribosomal protein S18 acetylase RimI-like enzyme
MSGLEVRPFQAADLRACGELLAQRHRDHRGRQPLLSARYTDPDAATAEVEAAVAAEHASGAVALHHGSVVGYLLGAPKAPTWGPNVWVESAGLATEQATLVPDLYAVAAARWVDEGRTAHYVVLPAGDPDLADAWFRLGFGLQHVHGLRPAPEAPPRPSTSVLVRPATGDDIAALARVYLELEAHQGRAPTFSAGQPETPEESAAAWRNYVDDPEYLTVVAERDGTVVGAAVGCSIEQSPSHTGLSRPDNAFFLGFAAVMPQARGSGAGRALGEAVLAVAATCGFDSVVADWRSTNLLASRTWPRLGFAESFLRLHRLVGY